MFSSRQLTNGTVHVCLPDNYLGYNYKTRTELQSTVSTKQSKHLHPQTVVLSSVLIQYTDAHTHWVSWSVGSVLCFMITSSILPRTIKTVGRTCLYDSPKPNKFFHMCPSPAAQLQHILLNGFAMCFDYSSQTSTLMKNVNVEAIRKEFPLPEGGYL